MPLAFAGVSVTPLTMSQEPALLLVSVKVNTYGIPSASSSPSRASLTITLPASELRMLALALALEALPLTRYGFLVCAKLFTLLLLETVTVLLLFGVVGAVRNDCPQVLAEEFLTPRPGGVRCLTILDREELAVLELWDRGAMLDSGVRLLLLLLPSVCDSGALSSTSLSGGSSGSRREERTSGSRGFMVRKISANRCINSRKRVLGKGRVEKRAYSYLAVKSVVVCVVSSTPRSIRWVR